MRELVVISGKGGTGKTSLTAAFAQLAENSVICDADVDAADLHLLLEPKVRQKIDFWGGFQAVIIEERCSLCGICQSICNFGAIRDDLSIDPFECEGCGVCVSFCPEQAIDFKQKKCGQWFLSKTRFGPMVHARLGIAEENSGKLVTLVRQEAKKLAEDSGLELLITDGPPGIGCPVIASLTGTTAVLIVTEPSLSGIHDMKRVVQLAAGFKIPVLVCINKSDLNLEQTSKIIDFCAQKELRYLGKIPYDPLFTKAMIQGQTILEFEPNSKVAQAVTEIWEKLMRAPEMNTISEIKV